MILQTLKNFYISSLILVKIIIYITDFVDSPENTHNNFIKLDFSELIDILKYDIESAKRDFLNFPALIRVNNIYGEEHGSSEPVYYYVKAATHQMLLICSI